MNLKYFRIKERIVFSLFIALFIISAIFSHQYSDYIQEVIQFQGTTGMVIYILLTIGSVVLAPGSVLPLLPIVVTLWGSFLAALLSIVGWMTGAMIAFLLARKYGRPLVKKFRFFNRIEKFEGVIPEKYLFWTVVFFRLVFPVDVLSYALGLFTRMSWSSYFLATIIGLSPFAFIFSYGVTLPTNYLIIFGFIVLLVIFLGYGRAKKRLLLWQKEKNGK